MNITASCDQVSTVVLGAVKNYSFGIVLYTIQHTPNTFDIQLRHAVRFIRQIFDISNSLEFVIRTALK